MLCTKLCRVHPHFNQLTNRHSHWLWSQLKFVWTHSAFFLLFWSDPKSMIQRYQNFYLIKYLNILERVLRIVESCRYIVKGLTNKIWCVFLNTYMPFKKQNIKILNGSTSFCVKSALLCFQSSLFCLKSAKRRFCTKSSLFCLQVVVRI